MILRVNQCLPPFMPLNQVNAAFLGLQSENAVDLV